MIVELERGTPEIVANLMQLYLHDLSEIDGSGIGDDGRYEYRWLDAYWREPERHAFVLRGDGAIAGFVLVRTLASGVHQMAEFFVLRSWRRAGVGTAAARALFDRFGGTWQVAEDDGNAAAQAFWRCVIGDYTGGRYREERSRPPDGPDGPMQVFEAVRVDA